MSHIFPGNAVFWSLTILFVKKRSYWSGVTSYGQLEEKCACLVLCKSEVLWRAALQAWAFVYGLQSLRAAGDLSTIPSCLACWALLCKVAGTMLGAAEGFGRALCLRAAAGPVTAGGCRAAGLPPPNVRITSASACIALGLSTAARAVGGCCCRCGCAWGLWDTVAAARR